MGGSRQLQGRRAHREATVDRNGALPGPPRRALGGAYSALLGLQRSAGNRAVASLLQASTADTGEVVQRCGGHACPPSGCHRSSSESVPASDLVQRALSSGGQPLPPRTRTELEANLGNDLRPVRVHTSAAAAASARAVDADAYTVGEHIVFDSGRYAPDTPSGMRMLAHELTHVIQQSRGPVDAAWRAGNLAVSDPNDRFERQAARTAESVMTGDRSSVASAVMPATGATASGAVVVQRQQPAGSTAPAARTVPRPAALPLDQGFTLYDLSSLPPTLANAVPEGQVATLALVVPVPPTGSATQRTAEALGVGAWQGLTRANAALTGYGLPGAVAGADAIGIIAIPRVNVGVSPLSPQFNLFDPAAPLDFWGHTAVYVRQGGRIVAVRGFNPATGSPSALAELLVNASRVEAGQGALPAVLSSDAYLFTSNAARSLEYPVTGEQLARFLAQLPEVGTGWPCGRSAGVHSSTRDLGRGTAPAGGAVLRGIQLRPLGDRTGRTGARRSNRPGRARLGDRRRRSWFDGTRYREPGPPHRPDR